MVAANVRIRPETPADYAAIADVNARAFANSAAEPVIVALQRARPGFDPELSLVAERDGQIVGHVLFFPERMNLLGESLPVVNLAPIAIHPAYQKQGIGGALIEAGHAAARAKGYVLSVLLGHPTYYPRFGYRTRVYGVVRGKATVRAAELPAGLHDGPLTADDAASVHALWRVNNGQVDFAFDPGPDLLAWTSPNPLIHATVYHEWGVTCGYVRADSRNRLAPLVFLARDAGIARAMAAHLVAQSGAPGGEADMDLPFHPQSALAGLFGPAHVEAWDAAMACPLAPSPFDTYYMQVQSGARPVGCITWPVSFDLAQ
ncbi:MAG: N-acetyltransferase [Anaerolineae bacterium]|nr:N-acetyltransferase [Anaerolineae bacterium]